MAERKKPPPTQYSLMNILFIIIMGCTGAALAQLAFYGNGAIAVVAMFVSIGGACYGLSLGTIHRKSEYTSMIAGAGFVWIVFLAPCLVFRGELKRSDPFKYEAADVCRGIWEAQEVYHRMDYTSNGVLKYSPDLNGLYGAKDGLISKALMEADLKGTAKPHSGYLLKLLTAQGLNAPGGQKSYIDAKGNMTGGFAFVAVPAIYDAQNQYSRFTYMISAQGVIYIKDLGPNGAATVTNMTEFDPDATWTAEK